MLSQDKIKLLSLMLQDKGVARRRRAVTRRRDTGPAPLSFAQQRLWFLDRLEPGSNFYHIPMGVRLRGRLDVEALARTFVEVVRRHEALRTTFVVVDEAPSQIISPSLEVELPVLDLSGLAGASREDEVRRLLAEEAAPAFDLERGPLLRARLLRLAEEEHVLLLTMHHIISDGWSIGVLIREVAVLYEAYAQGRPSPLEELPVQYADYAVCQRGWLRDEVLEGQLGYWRKQLSGAPAVLELPTDRPRPPLQSFRGTHWPFALPPALEPRLRELTSREGVTLFMVLLASFDVLLHYYTGRSDLVVGTDVANRNQVETEGLIGFFVNQLALRTDLTGDPTFRELLGQVRDVTLGAYSHQDLPFEKLVEALNPERVLNYSPVFQVKFVLQNAPLKLLELPGLTLTPLWVENDKSKFDLMLTVHESPEGLSGFFEYNIDLFDAATIARMAAHFEAVLTVATAQPGARLKALTERLKEIDAEHQTSRERAIREIRLQKYQRAKRKPVGGL